MDKDLIRLIQGIHDREARAADHSLESLASVFAQLDDEVMTRSEIIKLIHQYREILKEELWTHRP